MFKQLFLWCLNEHLDAKSMMPHSIYFIHSAKDDGVDIDALAAEIEGAGAAKEQNKGKSKKKKGGKKEDFE